MDAGSLTITINATDNASGVISGVSASVSGLGSAAHGMSVDMRAGDRAILGTAAAAGIMGARASAAARTTAGMAAEVGRARTTVETLTNGLTAARAQTREYGVAMRDSAKDVRAKQAAVVDAARAYKDTSKAVAENVTRLKGEAAMAAAVKAQRQNEVEQLKAANKSLDKNSQAYKDNQKAIKWTEAEIKAADAQRKAATSAIKAENKALNESKGAYERAQAAASDAAKAHNNLKESYKSSKAQERGIEQQIPQAQKALETAERQLAVIESAERKQELGATLKSVGERADRALKPLYAVGAAASAGLGLAAKAAIDFEDNFAAVKKTVDGTPEQLEAVKQGIIDMSTVGVNGHRAIPLTTAELTELAAVGGQLGIATENVVGFTETMAMLNTATNLTGEQGAATLARFMNVTNTSQDQVSNLGSAIVDLGNHYATTEAEIADMGMRMGRTGTLVGISAQDILAYSTVLTSMGIEAEAGGTAVARIWQDMQAAVSAGGDDLKEFAKVSGMTSEEFAKQWKNDASGAFQSFLKGLGELDEEKQFSLLDSLGFHNQRDISAIQALAGARGFPMLLDAIERSNKAWSENTALQTEFDAKAETTASKMAVLRNNATEAARSFGELMLPSLIGITGGLTGMVQGLAKADDGTKQGIINAALFTAGLGLAAKATTGVVKGVGDTVFAIGTLQKALGSGGVLAGIAPALKGAAAAAGPAALAIGGVVAAALVGKAAYDSWYNSQYRWTAGLGETEEKVRGAVSEYKSLAAAQKEADRLGGIISNPESSAEQIAQARQELDGLVSTLNQDYSLNIRTNAPELGTVVEQMGQAADISENRLMQSYNEQSIKLSGLREKEASYAETKAGLVGKIKEETTAQTKAAAAMAKMSGLQKDLKDGTVSASKALESAKEAYKDVFGKDYAMKGNNAADNIRDIMTSIASKGAVASENLKGLNTELDNLEGSHAELRAVSTEMSNWATEMIGLKAAAGDAEGVTTWLQNLGETIRSGGLDMYGYAQAAALAMNGVNSLNDAWAAAASGDGAALNGIVNDYITSLTTFGASAPVAVEGAALIANGFTDASQAAAKGQEAINAVAKSMLDLGSAQGIFANMDLSGISAQLTSMMKDVGLIGEGTKLTITAEGKIEWSKEDPPQPEPVTTDGSVEWDDSEPETEPVTTDGTINWEDTDPSQVVTGIVVDVPGTINWSNEKPDVPKETQTVDGQINWTVTVNGQASDGGGGLGSIFDNIKNFLFPTAEAAGGESVSVPVNVKAEPQGTPDTSALSSAVQSAISSAGSSAGGGESVPVPVDIKAVPGNIDTSELDAAMQTVLSGGEGGNGAAETAVDIKITAEGTVEWNDVEPPEVDEITAEGTVNWDNAEPPEAQTVEATGTVNWDNSEPPAPENVTAEGTVNWAESSPPVPDNVTVEGTVNYQGNFPTSAPGVPGIATYRGEFPTSAPGVSGTAKYTGQFPSSAPTIYGTAIYNVQYVGKAKGDSDFEGGMAMVNDQKGVADPTELITWRGHAWMYEGRDVIAPLPKGATIYTAKQTQEILKGIPHFADGNYDVSWDEIAALYAQLGRDTSELGYGATTENPLESFAKENFADGFSSGLTSGLTAQLNLGGGSGGGSSGDKMSEGYRAASEQLTHELATRATTSTEELQKWTDLLNTAAQSTKDIWNAEERIYAAQVKINNEWRDSAEQYISDRAAMSDWADYGDDAVAAFQRVQQKEYSFAEAGQQTWAEADKNVSNFGKMLFDERRQQSEAWIKHQKRYANMSIEDQAEAYRRIAEYTREYYEKGLIDLRTYREAATEIDELYLDAVAEHNEEVYGRWEKDMDYYTRARKVYDDWEDVGDSLPQVYARAIKKQQEFFDAGVIGWEEASDAMYGYALDMYEAADSQYDAILQARRDEIDELRESYSKQEQAMRDSWTVADRGTNIAELDKLIGYYQNAVTDTGMEKYKDLLKEREKLGREEELYQLQVKNNATLEQYEAEYTAMEEDKKNVLARLKMTTNNLVGNTDFIGGLVGDANDIATDIGLDLEGLSAETYNSLEDVKELLNGVIKAINNKKIGNSYNDSRTLTFNGSSTSQVLKEFNNVVVTGLSAIA